MAHTRVQLTPKEGEALLWGLSIIRDVPERVPTEATDPLAVLFSLGWDRKDIMAAANDLYEFAYGDYIAEPLNDIDKDILLVCVENTSWLQPYVEHRPELLGVAKQALRGLAAKLEKFGIEVNHIPSN
jgi:hypothetical protein